MGFKKVSVITKTLLLQLLDFIGRQKDFFQVLFFVVIGTVTVLTYLKAKRTLLQPIRTEVFKEQLKIFTDVLRYFTGKGEVELRQEFGFEELQRANMFALLDAYAHLFFDFEIPIDERPYNTNNCPISIVSERRLELADDYLIKEEPKGKKIEPKEKIKQWNDYKHDHVHIPTKFVEAEQSFQKLIDSPLLPTSCVELLVEYHKTIRKNIAILEDVLTEAAKELPKKYTSLSVMKKVSFDWLRNRYNDKFQELLPKAKEITDFVRQYYLTDKLLN